MRRTLPAVLRILGAAALVYQAIPAAATAQEPSGLQTLVALENVLAEAIVRGEKSVVCIMRVKKADPGDSINMQLTDAFNRPSGRFSGTSDPDSIPDADFVPNDYGTGVVVDATGLILTNYHVLGGEGDKIFVTTQQRKTYRTKIKAADPRSDLAILEITGAASLPSLTPVKFAPPGTVRKGQIVISLGNPYAIARDGQASASWGIVSNLARKAGPEPDGTLRGGKTALHHYGTLIQTDAKLNLGTSGGPLLNLKGEMIGLTTSLAALAGYEQAAGYAIPVDETFARVVETLKQGREVEYGFLGVQSSNLLPHEIQDGQHGMRINKVVPGTPAYRFGLRPLDVITEVNGEPIHDADGLMLNVGRLPAEAKVRLSIERDGYAKRVEVELAKYAVEGRRIVTEPEPSWRGLRIDFPTANTVAINDTAYFDRNAFFLLEGCVWVIDVEEGSPAWKAGLRRDMLISHVENNRVQTPREFRAAVAGKTGPVQVQLGVSAEEKPMRTIEPDNG